MTEVKTSITRQELYRLVWTKPARKLADELGISDVAIGKICRKAAIPKPPLGYWAKLQHGKKVSKPRLPAAPEGVGEEIAIDPERFRREEVGIAEADWTSIRDLIDDRGMLPLADDLRRAHPSVRRTRQLLESGSKDDCGRLQSRGEGKCLCVKVTRGSLRRALLIMDAVVKALERLGFTVSASGESAGRAVSGDDSVAFSIWEKVERVEKPRDEATRFYWREWDHHATGKLVFQFDEYYPERVRKSWSDAKIQRLEDKLVQIVGAFRGIHDAVRQARIEREEQQRRWREEERLRGEYHRIQQDEKARRETLDQLAQDHQRAELMRALIGRLKAVTSDDSLNEAWLTWAEGYADMIDPIANGKARKASTTHPDQAFYSRWRELAEHFGHR